MIGPFTREEFTEWYGPHPDWMWDMLVANYKSLTTRNVEQPKTWECDGCNQKWPNYQSWHDHNCPPKQVTQDDNQEKE